MRGRRIAGLREDFYKCEVCETTTIPLFLHCFFLLAPPRLTPTSPQHTPLHPPQTPPHPHTHTHTPTLIPSHPHQCPSCSQETQFYRHFPLSKLKPKPSLSMVQLHRNPSICLRIMTVLFTRFKVSGRRCGRDLWCRLPRPGCAMPASSGGSDARLSSEDNAVLSPDHPGMPFGASFLTEPHETAFSETPTI